MGEVEIRCKECGRQFASYEAAKRHAEKCSRIEIWRVSLSWDSGWMLLSFRESVNPEARIKYDVVEEQGSPLCCPGMRIFVRTEDEVPSAKERLQAAMRLRLAGNLAEFDEWIRKKDKGGKDESDKN